MTDELLETAAGVLPGPAGVAVGHAARKGRGWLTGCTVVLPPVGTVAGVDVRGGGPGTRETDALRAGTLVSTVDAVVLTGGSAFGLAAADGVMSWCESAGRGYEVLPARGNRPALRVPIVPAAVLFDLGRGGDPLARPDASFGYAAARAAERHLSGPPAGPERPHQPTVPRGSVGAGTGALVDRGRLRGGIGSAAVTTLGGAAVGALVAANAAGRPAGFHPARDSSPDTSWPPAETAAPAADPGPALNTTLVVVVTDAPLSPGEATQLAGAAHAGIARAVDPSHTLIDGDVVFALATGRGPVLDDPLARVALEAAAATAVTAAFADAVASAESTSTPAGTWPAASPTSGPPGTMGA